MVDRKPKRISEGGRTPRWKLMLGALLSVGVGLYLFNRSQTGMEQRTAMPSGEAEHSTRVKTAFEPTDWNVAPIAAIYVGVLVLLVLSGVAIIVAYPTSLPDVGRSLHINPPGPRLQTNDQADLGRFRAEEDGKLNGYYWIDRQRGVAHIPIGEAMQKLARSGIDGFPKAQQ
jgi:hypothetical protein